MPAGSTYRDAVRALESARRFGVNPSLDTIRALMARLGDPQRSLRVVQVAGTNGKGSTTRMVDALLRAHGRRSGAFVSPHLDSPTEHVLVDGAPIGEALFAAAVDAALDAAEEAGDDLAEPPTQFELLTAAALWALRAAGVEWAVLEVGMGGRWDSTSVALPEVAVVTSVGLDHVEHLGPTVERIAWDKAHVIRPGVRAVLGPGTAATDEVFASRTAETGAPLVRVREGEGGGVRFDVTARQGTPDDATRIRVEGVHTSYDLEVRGPAYQAENAACAVAAAELALGGALDLPSVDAALAELVVPGRFEVVARDPWTVVDAAHNAEGARALADAVRGAFAGRRVTVVLGMLSDKPAAEVVGALAPIAARFVAVRPMSDRAVGADELAAVVRSVTGAAPDTAIGAADAARSVRDAGEECLVTGSVVTVAEARRAFRPSVHDGR